MWYLSGFHYTALDALPSASRLFLIQLPHTSHFENRSYNHPICQPHWQVSICSSPIDIDIAEVYDKNLNVSYWWIDESIQLYRCWASNLRFNLQTGLQKLAALVITKYSKCSKVHFKVHHFQSQWGCLYWYYKKIISIYTYKARLDLLLYRA